MTTLMAGKTRLTTFDRPRSAADVEAAVERLAGL
jgi:hypothetical protein